MSKGEEVKEPVKEIVDLGNFIYQTLKDEDVRDKAFITDILSVAIIKAGYHFSPPPVVGDLREQLRNSKLLNVYCETCYLHPPKTYTRKDCVTYHKRECALETIVIDSILALIDIDKMARSAGYVKLAKDQTFPSGIKAVEKTLKDRGWRKIINPLGKKNILF